MDIKNFLDTVKNEIKYEPIRENIEEELKSHIEDAKDDLMSKGIEENEAEEKAVEAMGNPADIGKKLNKIHRPKFDWKLGILVLILLGYGIFIAILQEDTSNSPNMVFNILKYTIIGLILCIGVYFIDYRKIKKYSMHIYIAATAIMLMPYIGLSTRINGILYARVFRVTFLTATVTVPLYLIAFIGWITSYKKENVINLQIEDKKIEINKDKIKIIILSIISLGLMIQIPSISNAIVLCVSYLIISLIKIMQESKQKLTEFSKLLIPFVLLGIIFTFYLVSEPYRLERITSSFNPESDPNESGYEGMLQKEILEKAKWFGEADTDIIKSDEFIISKESNFAFIYLVGKQGIVVAGILVLTIILMSTKFILNAKNIKDKYGKFLIIGMGSLYIVQSIMSVLMNVNLAVRTGFYLPLVSYGEVYFIVNMICIGLVLSVYKSKDVIEYEEAAQ